LRGSKVHGNSWPIGAGAHENSAVSGVTKRHHQGGNGLPDASIEAAWLINTRASYPEHARRQPDARTRATSLEAQLRLCSRFANCARANSTEQAVVAIAAELRLRVAIART